MVVFQLIRPLGVWSFASLIQDLGVVAEKGAERIRIYECSCTKYVS